MNLYKIIFKHYAPKGSDNGIKALLLAENNKQVYEWIASELHLSWKDNEEDNEKNYIDDNGKDETFKERMIRLCGEINDVNNNYSDSFYGLTFLGWKLLKENVITDYSELIELGVMFKTRNNTLEKIENYHNKLNEFYEDDCC